MIKDFPSSFNLIIHFTITSTRIGFQPSLAAKQIKSDVRIGAKNKFWVLGDLNTGEASEYELQR